MAWYNFWKKANVATAINKSQWRNNMWVMSPYGIGVLFRLDTMCDVHLVDMKTGETTSCINVPLQALRQAKLAEIPSCRTKGLTSDRAAYLGYQ
jgi:hypothetical protein